MDSLNKVNIEYIPKKIYNEDVSGSQENASTVDELQNESTKVIDRLADHLAVIDSYNKRLESIDYLINNAEALCGSPKYDADEQSVLNAIVAMGENKNYVDFDLFKRSVDIILNNYDNMAILALSGQKP